MQGKRCSPLALVGWVGRQNRLEALPDGGIDLRCSLCQATGAPAQIQGWTGKYRCHMRQSTGGLAHTGPGTGQCDSLVVDWRIPINLEVGPCTPLGRPGSTWFPWVPPDSPWFPSLPLAMNMKLLLGSFGDPPYISVIGSEGAYSSTL